MASLYIGRVATPAKVSLLFKTSSALSLVNPLSAETTNKMSKRQSAICIMLDPAANQIAEQRDKHLPLHVNIRDTLTLL